MPQPEIADVPVPVPGILSGHTGTTRLTGRLITDAPSPSGTRPMPRLTPLFTDRKDILEQLATWFDPAQPSITLKVQRVFVLYGPGGAGKTQIMAKFANEFSDRFSGVYYVDGSTLETIKGSLEDIARYTSAGETSDSALRWFARQQTEWLLLIDNADKPEINLRQFLPNCTHGNIIITSRDQAYRQHAPDSNCNVVGMEPDEAIEFLLKSSEAERSTVNGTLCASICKELGYFALAVAQAGAYIAQSCSLDDYLELYHEDHAQLLKKGQVQTADDYQFMVYTTWKMNLKKLSSTATKFLRICAFMHREGISMDIFESAATASNASGSFEDGRRFLDNFQSTDGQWSNQKFLEVVKELTSYLLINIDVEDRIFSMHPLIHAFSREVDNPSEYEEARTCTLHILALSVPEGHNADASALQRTLLPHIDASRFGDMQLDTAERLQGVYVSCGRWQAAEELQTLVLDGKKKSLGDEHRDTIQSMINLVSTYWNQGRWNDAQELQLQVMAAIKRLLGDEHPDTIGAMSILASTYWKQGQCNKAEELQLQVMSMWKRRLGDEHPDTIHAMANLAATYRCQRRWNDAEELQLQVMATTKRLHGDEHLDTIHAMANLGSTYCSQGRLNEAEELELQVMATTKRLLGDDHPDTIGAMTSLASTYWFQGRWNDAEELELQVMATNKRLFGDEHPDTINAMASLASTYHGQRRWRQAQDLDLRVLESRRRLLGNDHPDTLAAKAWLSHAYTKKHRFLAWLHHFIKRS